MRTYTLRYALTDSLDRDAAIQRVYPRTYRCPNLSPMETRSTST
jgi:hypothetical protein